MLYKFVLSLLLTRSYLRVEFLFFIMSIWSEVVASQSVSRWWSVSLACRHNLHAGSISGLSSDRKYMLSYYVLLYFWSMYSACMCPFSGCILICFYLVSYKRALCAYTGELIYICFHLDVVYSSILLLATCHGIGVLVFFICDPPAAPSLADWSACSLPSIPTWALIQLIQARVKRLTSSSKWSVLGGSRFQLRWERSFERAS